MHSRRAFLRLSGWAPLARWWARAVRTRRPGLRRPGVSREDIAALNEALAFEHLEAGFYAAGRPGSHGSRRPRGSCWSASRRRRRRTWRR